MTYEEELLKEIEYTLESMIKAAKHMSKAYGSATIEDSYVFAKYMLEHLHGKSYELLAHNDHIEWEKEVVKQYNEERECFWCMHYSECKYADCDSTAYDKKCGNWELNEDEVFDSLSMM